MWQWICEQQGFLNAYKGVRYHLKEWGPQSARPQNALEMFNIEEYQSEKSDERAFGIIKMRWVILRSASYYPVKIQNRFIMAYFLLHNFIWNEMEHDPIEELIDTHQKKIIMKTIMKMNHMLIILIRLSSGVKKGMRLCNQCGSQESEM